jgi:hypothetical protein
MPPTGFEPQHQQAAALRLRPLGHWDWLYNDYTIFGPKGEEEAWE